MQRDHPDRPVAGVSVVVLCGGSVLLIRRRQAPRVGQWSLPGGAQELGETVEHTARRELREETGLSVGRLRLIDVVDLIDRDEGAHVVQHYTLIDFATELGAAEPRAGGDAAEIRWAPLDGLEAYNLWDDTRRVIELAATRRPR